jgi:uncharacterized membrane protein YphA (DoxX/SURF4 family)
LIRLAELAGAWNAFFHAPESPATISLFRIVFGTVLLTSGLLLAREAQLWFGPAGVMAPEFHARAYRATRFTLLNYFPPTEASVTLLFALHLTAAFCLLVGFLTPLAAAVAFVTLTSIQHRNPLSLHGGDSVLRVMCFLLVFAGAGRMWSVDAALGLAGPAAPASPWCLRVMQVMLSVLYFRSAWWKVRGPKWRNGSAVHYPLNVLIYQRFALPRSFTTPAMVRTATWGTLGVEFALGPLVWIDELRYPVLALGILLHLGIEVALNVQLFGWTMISCLFLFLRPEHVQALLGG